MKLQHICLTFRETQQHNPCVYIERVCVCVHAYIFPWTIRTVSKHLNYLHFFKLLCQVSCHSVSCAIIGCSSSPHSLPVATFHAYRIWSRRQFQALSMLDIWRGIWDTSANPLGHVVSSIHIATQFRFACDMEVLSGISKKCQRAEKSGLKKSWSVNLASENL